LRGDRLGAELGGLFGNEALDFCGGLARTKGGRDVEETRAGAGGGGARHLNRNLFIQPQFLVEARVVGPASPAPPAETAASAAEDRGGYGKRARIRLARWRNPIGYVEAGQARQFVLDGGAALTGLGRLGEVHRLRRGP